MKKVQWKYIVVIGMLLTMFVFLLISLNRIEKNMEKYDELSVTEKTTYHFSDVEIYLPEVYYVADSLQMNIYNNQITNLGTHISEYRVEWFCGYPESEVTEQGLIIQGKDGSHGSYDFGVAVYDRSGLLLAKKDAVLKIVEAKKKQFSVLTIGDSLSANGELYARLQEHFENQMICNGTRGYEGFLTEARPGFSAKDYLTETGYYLEEGEAVHKFWNPETERFDWNYYKTSTGFQPDVILLHLGTNGLLSGEENGENICEIVELIRRDDKKIPIYVVNTIYQSDQNGIGSMKMNNGSLMFPGQYKHDRDLANFELREYLAQHLSELKNVYLVPASISVDSERVFMTENRMVNPYSAETEAVAVDAVHPAAEGYRQIADAIYSTMCGTMKN